MANNTKNVKVKTTKKKSEIKFSNVTQNFKKKKKLGSASYLQSQHLGG